MDKFKELILRHKELLMYTVVGVSMTFFNWFMYSSLINYVPMIIANAMSWMFTVLISYLGNKLFVFDSKDWTVRTICREGVAFMTARGATGAIEIVAQPMLFSMGINESLFGVQGLQAKIIVCLAVAVINYVSTKQIVFRTVDSRERVELGE